jgi:hypothetical protein
MASYDGSNFAGCIAGFLLSDIRVLTEIREVWEVLPLLAAFARQKKTLRCPERPLFPSYAFDRAPAAKVRNPPLMSKSAWRSISCYQLLVSIDMNDPNRTFTTQSSAALQLSLCGYWALAIVSCGVCSNRNIAVKFFSVSSMSHTRDMRPLQDVIVQAKSF